MTLAQALQLLGIPESTPTPDRVKSAFRAKAKQLHPDAGGDADSFRLLKQAYDLALREAERPKPRIPEARLRDFGLGIVFNFDDGFSFNFNVPTDDPTVDPLDSMAHQLRAAKQAQERRAKRDAKASRDARQASQMPKGGPRVQD